jgi:hypothetical protein
MNKARRGKAPGNSLNLMSKLENVYFDIMHCLTDKNERLYSTAFLLPLAMTFIKGSVHTRSRALSACVMSTLILISNGRILA